MSRRMLASILVGVVVVIVFVGVVVWGITTVGSRTENNCDRIHQLVNTLDTILASGESQTRKYVAEGTLTPEQGERADREREKQRRVLAGADCHQ